MFLFCAITHGEPRAGEKSVWRTAFHRMLNVVMSEQCFSPVRWSGEE